MYAKNLKKPIVVLMLEDLKESEMSKINSIIRNSIQIPVYDYKNKLLEKSDSELYQSIIEAVLENLKNIPLKNELDDTASIESLNVFKFFIYFFFLFLKYKNFFFVRIKR